jgi:S-DNA-T family DNA segregation ATPase FtsK/SpoIIIE
MRLKLSLQRPSGDERDIVVTADAAATVGEVAAAIEQRDPSRAAGMQAGSSSATLVVRFPGENAPRTLARDTPLAEASVASGAAIILTAQLGGAIAGAGPALAYLRVIAGPDKGKEFALRGGSVVIGRQSGVEIELTDPLVSKRHARVEVTKTVDLVDLNSANGLIVDGVEVSRIALDSGQTVVLGDTELRAELVANAAPTEGPKRTGPVAYVRSPRVEQRYPGTEYEGPEIPKETEPHPFPWLALAVPAITALAFLLIPGLAAGAQRFVYLALAPILMIGTFVTQLSQQRRKRKAEIAKFEEQLDHLRTTLEGEVETERAVRLQEAPSTDELLAVAASLGPGLWTRRPEHWSFLNVRLGTGTADSRNTIQAAGTSSNGLPEYLDRLDAVAKQYHSISGVPIVENFLEAGAIGIAGSGIEAAEAANSLLAQVAGLYSPAELSFAALVGPTRSPGFEWLKWLPHTGSPQSPLGGIQLADNAASGSVLLASLEDLIQQRSDNKGASRGPQSPDEAVMVRGQTVGEQKEDGLAAKPTTALLLLISSDAPVDHARLVQLAERAADANIIPVWIGDAVAELPAVCRTYLDVGVGDSPSTVGYVRIGRILPDVVASRLSYAGASQFARLVAGISDASALDSDDSDLPRSVSFASLLGTEILASSDAALERWRENNSVSDRTPGAALKPKRAGNLRAIVGQGSLDAMHLDLRTQGPHALVGGTTGSGKSEFLQAWVLGMAAEYSPDRVTFLFVDYKGGSAFADCVKLPHCVGLVTDLSPRLVRRALTSLRAELHYREHLLNRKKAKDLIELEKRGDPEAPPALVLVIDEFAALAGDVPDFVDGVVDVAQRGRSLGIHLIMATQRPAGVIRDNLRANTNLRIALRMADESDSMDVVGDKIAGTFDPTIPGRAIAKTGPGRLTGFQSAYAGGWTSEEIIAPSIEIADLRFGSEQPWEDPTAVADAPGAGEQGPTDQSRIVHSLIAASASAHIPQPRRPWLPELAPVFDLTRLRQRTDTELVLGVSDLPETQLQQEVYFRPDLDGNIAIFGAGGAGKSVTLRTLAAAAGITPRGGPTDVYGLDFGTGGLRMLEVLPHVGSIVGGDDPERVIRLLRMLRDLSEDRAARYTAVNAGNIVDYRRIANAPDERRILLLVDNYPSFRTEFESGSARAPWYGVFQQLLTEGRGLGIHVALTADRPGSVPTSVTSAVQRRVVLRLADDTAYVLLDAPADVLLPTSPPGRCLIDGNETQIAVLGGTTNVVEQSTALTALAAAITGTGRGAAVPVGTLPQEFPFSSLPATVGTLPVLGIADDSLQPIGFEPSGVFLFGGPPASGRTNALRAMIRSLDAAVPGVARYYIGNPRSVIGGAQGWTSKALTVDDAAALAKELAVTVADPATTGKVVVVIEQIADFLSSPADSPIVELVKAIKRSDHFLVADSETSQWGSSWPILAEIKAARTGFLIQPDGIEGETILKTALPRVSRNEFPTGRGYFIARGKATRVQLPLVDEA